MPIYFDNAATTQIDPLVLEAMMPYLVGKYGNASSLHTWGREAREAVEKARETVAELLGASPEEIIFTGGGSEALFIAIVGTGLAMIGQKTKLFTSPIEHHAALDPFDLLTPHGLLTATIPVAKDGLIDLDWLKKNIDEKTGLVNIMYVNNEVGTIQEISEISNLTKSNNLKLSNSKTLFHSDATAAKYEDLNVKRLGVDLMTLTPHKFYGPKGIGILYIKKGTKIKPIIKGKHEHGLRAGTENTAYIVGAAKALELLEKTKQKNKNKLAVLQQRIIKGVTRLVKNARLTGHPAKRCPDITSFLVSGVEGEAMLLRLDAEGIAVSSGSACTSGDLMPSHVLRAMGYKPEECHGSLRVSLGKYNTEKEVEYFLKVFPKIVDDLRRLAPKFD